MPTSPTPPPRPFFHGIAAWRPTARSLWLVLAAFLGGLALFLLVWSGDRNDDQFFRAGDSPPTARAPSYTPLPAPLPARGREGDASGLERGREEAARQQEEQARLIEESPPPPPPQEIAPPTAAPALTSPRPIAGQTPPPTYPARALRRGEQGVVRVRADIGPDGVPTSVSVAGSSGSRQLDRAAVNAVLRWRFEPATANGQPTVGTVEVPIEFNPGR